MRRTVGAFAAALVGLAVLAGAPSVGAQVRAAGGVTVHDDPDCGGQGNSAKVTPPFSLEITGLTPNSTTSTLYVTDKDAHPEVVYGPFTIPDVGPQGNTCVNIVNAPAGVWKVDVVEDGSGFTDSKVFTVEGDQPTPTAPTPTAPTPTAPTTTAPTPTTTGSSSTSSLPGPPTTGSPPTTSPSPTSLPAPVPPSAPPIARPWSLLPWTLGPPTSAPTSAPSATTAPTGVPGVLPATGGSDTVALVALVLLGLGAVLLIVAQRFRTNGDT